MVNYLCAYISYSSPLLPIQPWLIIHYSLHCDFMECFEMFVIKVAMQVVYVSKENRDRTFLFPYEIYSDVGCELYRWWELWWTIPIRLCLMEGIPFESSQN